jgi:hypothetical protein
MEVGCCTVVGLPKVVGIDKLDTPELLDLHKTITVGLLGATNSN